MFQTLPGQCSIPRAVAIAALAVVCLQGTPADAQKRDVSFRLDWIYQGPNAGFMVAKDKGFYDEAGLNVDMGPGKGSGSTAQLIASKTSQFGFADGFVVGAGVAKGMELAMVGAIYRRNPTAAIVLEESGIKTAKDLEGKSIGIAPGGTQFQQWPHIGHLPVEVNGKNRLCARRDLLLDLFDIHCVRRGIDIDKHRRCADVADAPRGGDERHRDGDHLVPGPDAGADQRQVQR